MARKRKSTEADRLRAELAQARALNGELSTQLQEAIQARTNMGVSLRLAQARIQELESETEPTE